MLQHKVRDLSREIINELNTFGVLKEGIEGLLDSQISSSLQDVQNPGSIKIYYNADECPLYTEDVKGQGVFWLSWIKSNEEQKRENKKRGGSAPEVCLGYGDFFHQTLVIGSMDNYDAQTKKYIKNKVVPTVSDFFKHFSLTTTLKPSYGFVHGSIVD